MSETKRRTKNEKKTEGSPAPAPPRRARVTLTKDVSSRYRQLKPRQGPGSRRPDGPGPDGREPEARDPGRRKGPYPSEPERGTYGPRPSGPRPSGSRPTGPRPSGPRPGGPRPSGARPAGPRPSGPRPFGPPRARGEEERPPRGAGRPFASKRFPGPPEAMKALANRELPEALKQVRETRDLLQTAADEMLNHLEELRTLETGAGRGPAIITALLEKMSFQDLAGQRLAKVEAFLKALSDIVKDSGPDDRPPPKARPFKTAAPPPFARKEKGKPAPRRREAALKGPQAAGGGLVQKDIDALLADL